MIAAAVEEKRNPCGRHRPAGLPRAVEAVRRWAVDHVAVVSGASRVEVFEAIDQLGLRQASPSCWGRGLSEGQTRPRALTVGESNAWVCGSRLLVIEDATPGILSGRAAGARVVAVQAGNFSGYDLSVADAVVDTLDQVTHDLLAGLIAFSR